MFLGLGLGLGLAWALSWPGITRAQGAAPVPPPDCTAPTVAAGPSGAYRTVQGEVLSVLPGSAPGQFRLIDFSSGRSHRLHPAAPLRFQSGQGFDDEHPVAYTYHFTPQSAPAGERPGRWALAIDTAGQTGTRRAQPIALRERAASFTSGDARLQGRLTLPAEGSGPFKTVVWVHGSDPVPSVGREWLPHLLASQGIATLVFDKRGTGCSTGQYVQHFGVLSDDVVAAVAWLATQPEVDARAIGLAGFSQGGWVAPLAAAKQPSIRFVAVAYGLAMSMADEDRLEAPLKLRQAGIDDAGVAEFEQVNALLHRTAREGFRDWQPLEAALAQHRDKPWLAETRRQGSWMGLLLQMGLAQAKATAPAMFTHFFQPFYEPEPTLQQLTQPMLWLIAGDDIEAPPGPTLAVLERLKRQGKPVSVTVFPNADHGMQRVEQRGRERVKGHYAPGYFEALLRWTQAVR